MRLIDTHCHLDFPALVADRAGVIERARAAGVTRMITICTEIEKFATIAAIAESYEDIYCSVGTHPNHAGDEREFLAEDIAALAAHPKCVAIGEAGLDFYYDKVLRDKAHRVFRAHIEAARMSELPLVIHTRDADDDMAEILAEEMAKRPFKALLHCFSSSRALAEKAVELGLYISFSGIVTFKNSQELRDIARDIPRDRLLVETDAPFLAPVPKRGKINEPSFVAHTAKIIAEAQSMDPGELAEVTTANAFRLFDKMPALSK